MPLCAAMDGFMRRREPQDQAEAVDEMEALHGALERLERKEEDNEEAPASANLMPGAQNYKAQPSEEREIEEASEGLRSSPASAHPFWSPRARAEIELKNARPKALEDDEKRLGGREADAVQRPQDLEDRSSSRKEVRVDDREVEPDYSPFSGVTSRAEGGSAREVRESGAAESPVGQPAVSAGSELAQGPGPQVALGQDSLDLGPRATFCPGPLALPDQEGQAEPGARGMQSEHGEGSVPWTVQELKSRSATSVGQRENVAADADLELVRMRSLVEHLVDRLEKVEGDRASFGSASSGKLGWVDFQALDRELAKQSQMRELEAFTQQGIGPSSSSFRVPPVPSLAKSPPQLLPLDVPASRMPPEHVTTSCRNQPQYFALSPRAATTSGMSGVTSVNGVSHTWRVVNGMLHLEPLEFVDFKGLGCVSPPPRPPLSTPPPSPPPMLPPKVEGMWQGYHVHQDTLGVRGSPTFGIPQQPPPPPGVDGASSSHGEVSCISEDYLLECRGLSEAAGVGQHTSLSEAPTPCAPGQFIPAGAQSPGTLQRMINALLRTLGNAVPNGPQDADALQQSSGFHVPQAPGAHQQPVSQASGVLQQPSGFYVPQAPGAHQQPVSQASGVLQQPSGFHVPQAPGAHQQPVSQASGALQQSSGFPVSQAPGASQQPSGSGTQPPSSGVLAPSGLGWHTQGCPESHVSGATALMPASGLPPSSGLVNQGRDTSGVAITDALRQVSGSAVPGEAGTSTASPRTGPGIGMVGEPSQGKVPLQETGTSRGRGEFEPGDRTFWDLPRLAPVHESGAAVRASDWLYRSTLMLKGLIFKVVAVVR